MIDYGIRKDLYYCDGPDHLDRFRIYDLKHWLDFRTDEGEERQVQEQRGIDEQLHKAANREPRSADEGEEVLRELLQVGAGESCL